MRLWYAIALVMSILVILYGLYFFLRRTTHSKIAEASTSKLISVTVVTAFLLTCLTAYHQWKIHLEQSRIYTVTIEVLDSRGQPVTSADVSASVAGNIDVHGSLWRFEIPGNRLGEGRTVVFYASADLDRAGSAAVRISPRQTDSHVTIVLQDSLVMRGIVVDRNGRPVPNAIVETESHLVHTDQTGTFALLLPARNAAIQYLRISAMADGFTPRETLYPVGRDPITIVLYPSRTGATAKQ